MTDLNTQIPAGSGVVLEWARAVNDAGAIVADGEINGPVLTPAKAAPIP